MTERPAWTLARAAQECGVSRDTIKRRRSAGAFPNAYQGEKGAWLIPIEDLLAAGFQPSMSKPAREPERAETIDTSDSAATKRIQELEHENELLQVRLDTEQQLRAMADQAATDLRMSLRMLEATPTPRQAPVEPEPPPRRRWWHI
jgi:hypothetical protein